MSQQVCKQGISGRVSIRRMLFQTVQNDCLQTAGNVAIDVARPNGTFFCDDSHQFIAIRMFERRALQA